AGRVGPRPRRPGAARSRGLRTREADPGAADGASGLKHKGRHEAAPCHSSGQRDQVFIAAFTASAVMGSERTRAPTALKIALAMAGATTVTAGSPQPDGGSLLAITEMSRSG